MSVDVVRNMRLLAVRMGVMAGMGEVSLRDVMRILIHCSHSGMHGSFMQGVGVVALVVENMAGTARMSSLESR